MMVVKSKMVVMVAMGLMVAPRGMVEMVAMTAVVIALWHLYWL